MEETTGSRMWRAALAYAKPALARPDTTWANFRIVRGIVRQERHVRIVSLLKLGTTQARRLIEQPPRDALSRFPMVDPAVASC
jgi:hypothetical protein